MQTAVKIIVLLLTFYLRFIICDKTHACTKSHSTGTVRELAVDEFFHVEFVCNILFSKFYY